MVDYTGMHNSEVVVQSKVEDEDLKPNEQVQNSEKEQKNPEPQLENPPSVTDTPKEIPQVADHESSEGDIDII